MTGARPPKKPRSARPSHPHLAAALLMIGVVLFLVVSSLLAVY